MKRKLTILGIGLVAAAALMAVYPAGWLKGQAGQGTALVKEAQAAGGVVKDPKGAAPDRTRKSEYTQFILDGKFDTSDVDGPWLKKFMKEHGLTEDDLKAGR